MSDWISLKDKWLRRNRLILCIWHRLLYWHRLLGYGGLTPSRRRRLDSWPSHLRKKLINPIIIIVVAINTYVTVTTTTTTTTTVITI